MAVFIPKHYLVALALVGAVVVGFFSHLITDQLGGGRPGGRDATQPAAVVAKPVSTGPSVVVPSDPPSAPNPPIVSQPGGGGSTTNIYLTIVNTPGGTSASPPTINVAPNP